MCIYFHICTCIFTFICINYWKAEGQRKEDRVEERRKGTDRAKIEIWYLLAHSPNVCISQVWDKTKPEANTFILIFHMSGRFSCYWVIINCFPRPVAGSLIGSLTAGTQTYIPMWDASCSLTFLFQFAGFWFQNWLIFPQTLPFCTSYSFLCTSYSLLISFLFQ